MKGRGQAQSHHEGHGKAAKLLGSGLEGKDCRK